jgi:hypothetical protein
MVMKRSEVTNASKEDNIDTAAVIDKMMEEKKFITKKIQEGKKHELKGKFKFADPL